MSTHIPFVPADILLPKTGFSKWAVVACDQFTSQPDYWEKADCLVGDAPSTLRLILPEIYLSDDPDSRTAAINTAMSKYLADGVYEEYKNALVYIERTQPDGLVRRGIVGAVDLETYDFAKGTKPLVRATEGTVLERIPPRVKIREHAPIELPHVMLLTDDPNKTIIEPCTDDDKTLVYDFELMLGGGHIRGYLLSEPAKARVADAIKALLDAEVASEDSPMLFAVGDGNHSLATAKTCYLKNPTPSNRYALVELVNIHDDALEFEPIYRVLFNVDPDDVIAALRTRFPAGGPQELTVITSSGKTEIGMSEDTALPVGTLQAFIDEYLTSHSGASVDYIHGEDVVCELAAKPNAIGFIFEGMGKSLLFPAVKRDGALPRKTFSMGEAAGKRYYIEGRRIDPLR